MRKTLNIIIPLIVCFIVGASASCFHADSIKNWYPTLVKPSLTPPNIAFPIAWSIIYLLMGISIGFILNSKIAFKKSYVSLFIIQLLLNFTWTVSFFYLQSPLLGLINIIILDMLVILYIIKTYRVSKISSYLFVPYLLWIIFATYLNAYIFIYN